jgi:hypothetical protein
VALCDYPLQPPAKRASCDARLCDQHRRPQPGKGADGSDWRDYCPTHDELGRKEKGMGDVLMDAARRRRQASQLEDHRTVAPYRATVALREHTDLAPLLEVSQAAERISCHFVERGRQTLPPRSECIRQVERELDEAAELLAAGKLLRDDFTRAVTRWEDAWLRLS